MVLCCSHAVSCEIRQMLRAVGCWPVAVKIPRKTAQENFLVMAGALSGLHISKTKNLVSTTIHLYRLEQSLHIASSKTPMIESSNDQRSLSNESTIRFWKKTSESILTKQIIWYSACQPSNHAEALCTVHERRKNRYYQKPDQKL
ncbi:hypothetical protein ACOMHN_020216 [Nucella lapillus]